MNTSLKKFFLDGCRHAPKGKNKAASNSQQCLSLNLNWLTKTNAGATKCSCAAPNVLGLCPDVYAVCTMLWAHFKM